jgi:hypothetical protein
MRKCLQPFNSGVNYGKGKDLGGIELVRCCIAGCIVADLEGHGGLRFIVIEFSIEFELYTLSQEISPLQLQFPCHQGVVQ